MKALISGSEVQAAYQAAFRGVKAADLAYALATDSGLDLLLPMLTHLLESGGYVRALIGTDLPTPPSVFRRLLDLHGSFPDRAQVRRFHASKHCAFHPKFAVFRNDVRGARAIVGSSNLTSGGLEVNWEANVVVSDPVSVRRLSDYFDELFDGGHALHVSQQWLDQYEARWQRRLDAERAQRAARQAVLDIRRPRREVPTGIRGRTFAFTGRITGWPRASLLYPEIARLGGMVARSPRSMARADFLVHAEILGGRKTTLKLRAARSRGMPIITQEEFLRVLEKSQRRKARRST